MAKQSTLQQENEQLKRELAQLKQQLLEAKKGKAAYFDAIVTHKLPGSKGGRPQLEGKYSAGFFLAVVITMVQKEMSVLRACEHLKQEMDELRKQDPSVGSLAAWPWDRSVLTLTRDFWKMKRDFCADAEVRAAVDRALEDFIKSLPP